MSVCMSICLCLKSVQVCVVLVVLCCICLCAFVYNNRYAGLYCTSCGVQFMCVCTFLCLCRTLHCLCTLRAGVSLYLCIYLCVCRDSINEAELNLFHTCPSLPGGGASGYTHTLIYKSLLCYLSRRSHTHTHACVCTHKSVMHVCACV